VELAADRIPSAEMLTGNNAACHSTILSTAPRTAHTLNGVRSRDYCGYNGFYLTGRSPHDCGSIRTTTSRRTSRRRSTGTCTIAGIRRVSPRTVRKQLDSIYRKIGVHDWLQVVTCAERVDLLRKVQDHLDGVVTVEPEPIASGDGA
jgi:hypothetical protein